MKLFGFEIKKEAAPAQAYTPEQLRVANFLAEREKKQQVQKILIDLVEQTKTLTKQEVGRWRSAWQRAISVEWPSRIELLQVYRDVEMDNHLTGVLGQVYNNVLQKEFKVVDRTSGEEIPDLTKQLEDAQWFIDFCKYALESITYGYSLIQFGDVVVINGVKKFNEVELIPREHVVPEHGVFLKYEQDHYSNGTSYLEPPYSHWVIPVGHKKDLGLYNKVARHAISKKNVEAFWDKFAEIFGMPIRIGKTNSKNPKDRNEMSEMLQKMGMAAWGMFDEDSTIEIKETTRGDAYEVYDRRIERANSEMSKAIVNQTMTIDNGSSKAQGNVHLEVQEHAIEYFARMLRVVINDKLIPFLILHGFNGWDKAKFRYDDSIELTPTEQKDIEKMILEHYEVDGKHFAEKYNLPIIGKKEKTVPPAAGSNAGFFD
ncbi:MAG TPA: DUF935 family protein [Ferruginibacter sp.]|mgnify:CR=1 FL=1|nr:DUF935 family protein [Ferruginibacter sp.]HMP22187.1 DUF935 family protein [Ferruginibacter sp.]